jgi:hypothetical protein
MTENSEWFEIRLPCGLWLDGECHRDAYLRPIAGIDEAFMERMGETILPVQRITALLTRCIARLGPIDCVTAKEVSRLTAGDREALLLHLHRLTLGDKIRGILNCPSCKDRMGLELRAGDLLLPQYAHAQEWFEREIKEDGKSYQIHFRSPNGSDIEAAAVLVPGDLEGSWRLMLQRCVKRVSAMGEGELSFDKCPPKLLERLSALMAELDPQAEIVLDLKCPACGHSFSALLDAATFLFEEIAALTEHLYRDVHFLAFCYHWSEAEILALPSGRRHRYIDSLAEELSG